MFIVTMSYSFTNLINVPNSKKYVKTINQVKYSLVYYAMIWEILISQITSNPSCVSHLINSIVREINTSKSTYGKLLYILQYQTRYTRLLDQQNHCWEEVERVGEGKQIMRLCVREKTSLHKKCLLSRSYTSPLHDWTFLLVVYEFSTVLLHCVILRHYTYHNIKVIVFTINPIPVLQSYNVITTTNCIKMSNVFN